MIDPIDVEHSKYEIAKAEARLAYERHVIRDMPNYDDPSLVSKQRELIYELRFRLAYALARHASLLEELSTKLEMINEGIGAHIPKI